MSIELHAFDTPNGRKISVALEEMTLPYTVKIVDLRKRQQFVSDGKFRTDTGTGPPFRGTRA